MDVENNALCDEMVQVAMNIIIHAGDARMQAESALVKLRTFEFQEAKKLIEEAEAEMLLAHEAQTALIQKEASGIKYENSLLFNHAQDTLMTSKTKIEIAKEICILFEIMYTKFN